MVFFDMSEDATMASCHANGGPIGRDFPKVCLRDRRDIRDHDLCKDKTCTHGPAPPQDATQ
jgi:hypothetical protein